MFQMGLKQTQAGFFDRPKVESAAERGHARVQSRFGAFVRRRMKSSIKNAPWVNAAGESVRGKRQREKQGAKPATAAPGNPPYSHEGSLKRLIFFARDPATNSVVIGPAAFKKSEAPHLLEFGGDVTRKRKEGGTRRAHYEGNPFVRPAGNAELYSEKFRNLLRGMAR